MFFQQMQGPTATVTKLQLHWVVNSKTKSIQQEPSQPLGTS